MNKMTCNKCGRSITDDSVFCPDCGAAIFRSAPAAPSAPPPPEPALEKTPAEIPQKKPDYKKLIAPAVAVLAVVLLLVFGWDSLTGIFGPKDDPILSTSPSTEATVPSTQPPTQKPTPPPTETEPPEPDLSWYISDPQNMSYQDFFAEDRPHTLSNQTQIWHSPVPGSETVYSISRPQATFPRLFVAEVNGQVVYEIPNTETTTSYQPLGTDGTYVYLADQYENASQIIRIDLLTGNTTVIAQYQRILDIQLYPDNVLYYAAAEGSQLKIYRVYLPTLTTDLICELEIHPLMPGTWFSFSVSSTQGTVSWNGLSPEILDALYAEFSNPDSVYYPGFGDPKKDLSEFWENPDLLRNLYYDLRGSIPMMKLQDDKNLQAMLRGTYNIADGATTLDWGVVDSCWFGSGLPHDHWNPELTEDIPPTILDTGAMHIPEMVSPSAEMAENIRQETSQDENKLYSAYGSYSETKPVQIYRDGQYQTLTQLPYVKENTHLVNSKYYTYYPSVDNTIIQLDLSGNASVIYTAKHGKLEDLCYNEGNLYFLDGNTIVMLDTIACTSRELLSHPGRIWMYYDTYDQGLYIETVLGMAVNAYLFDPVTDTIEETNFRL